MSPSVAELMSAVLISAALSALVQTLDPAIFQCPRMIHGFTALVWGGANDIGYWRDPTEATKRTHSFGHMA